MPRYNLEARYFILEDLRQFDDGLIEKLWQLYLRICEFWQTPAALPGAKQQLLTFISNRIELDLRYLAHYVNYASVINELIAEQGSEQAAYQWLFTNPAGNFVPPITNLGQAKQFVVNEFIALNLSIGGFKTFGDNNEPDGVPLNYPGFIGGINELGHTPYRTATASL